MSDLLNQASLVIVPSGYKEDTVYSVVPSDGSGDLSFTRASNGTRVNSAGLVEVVPWNFIQYSEDFSNAAYTNIRINVTTNAVANPINGTVNADKLIADTNNGLHALRQTVLFQTVFIYAKKGESDQIAIRDDGNTGKYASFNLTSGTIIDFSNSGGTQSITSIGNGWYLCQINFATQGEYLLGVYCLSNSYTSGSPTVAYTGNGTDGLFVWGYQANIGSTAKPYFPTTDRLNVPRLTYQNGGGGCPSLLLEKQSTNLTLYSEQFDNASWTKAAVSVTANNITSPDGTQNADLLTTTSASICGAYQLISNGSGTFSFFIFAKKGNNNYLALNAQTSSADNCTAIFDLSDGTLGEYQTKGTTAYVSHKIENFGNDWYRCTMVLTATSNAYFFPMFAPLKTGNTFNASGEVSVASGKTLYLWGCQVEASSYPTSYIPTTSSSATRVADACYKTGISSLIGQTEGTLFINMNINKRVDLGGTGPNGLQIKDTSGNNVIVIGTVYFTNQQFSLSIRNSGSFSTLLTTTNNSFGTYKLAASYNSSGFVFYVNGVQIGTSATPPPSATFADIGVMQVFNLNNSEGELVNEAILFPTRLTNAELASLTTL